MIFIGYIGYITMKDFDYERINSVNLCPWLLVKQMDTLKKASNDKNKEVLIKYTYKTLGWN